MGKMRFRSHGVWGPRRKCRGCGDRFYKYELKRGACPECFALKEEIKKMRERLNADADW